jgi:hypothetical protein
MEQWEEEHGMKLNPKKRGVTVVCIVCGRHKKPMGRSEALPMAGTLCNEDCEGYELNPRPGHLWPRETEAEFGYAVPDDGTEIFEEKKS